jgi:CHAT domain-containing protein
VSPNYALTYRNIGRVYLLMKKYDDAQFYLERAKENLDSCLMDPGYSSKVNPARAHSLKVHALFLYNFMAEFYTTTHDLKRARFYYQKSIPLLKENPSAAFLVDKGLGRIARQEGNFEQAIFRLENALRILEQQNLDRGFDIAAVYREMSEVCEDQNDFNKALSYIQKALNSLQQPSEPDISNSAQNPSLSALLSNKETMNALLQKASLQYKRYHNGSAPDDLQRGLETIRVAIELLDSTRNDFSLEKDKVVLGEETVPYYELAMKFAHQRYVQTNDRQYLSEFFQYMEKSKSAVLLDHLKLVRSFSGIPSELQERERQLKVELSIREDELFKKESQQVETGKIRIEIDELKKKYAALNSEIKSKYPNYYSLKISNSVTSLDDLQRSLPTDQALVEYFVGDTTLYCIWISAPIARVFVSPLDSLEEKVRRFRSQLTESKYFLNHEAELKQCAEDLGHIILPWSAEVRSSTINSLIVVPQGILNYIPFEIVRSPETSSHLMDQFSISYALSASLLSQQRIAAVNDKVLAGFNATYARASGLAQLGGSVVEIDEIVNLFGGSSKAYNNASADEFRKEAGHYRILHLALHSFLNDDRPLFSRLIFTGSDSVISNSITANELYSMELNSELVVLSACETGIGVLHRGEGMMSLSRAFMYAGVPSTVMSLWKVPDQASALLMTEFYKFIQQGLRKDIALTMAKQEFVKNNPEMAHPFFWAGFVVNGKTDAIVTSDLSLRRLLPWFIGSLVVAAVVFFRIRRPKS